MAEPNSRDESGLSHSPCIPASVSFQQKGAMLLLQADWDPNWTGDASHREYKLAKRPKQHKYQPSSGSEKSSPGTGPSHSLSISGHLPDLTLDPMDLNSPSGLPHTGSLSALVTESLNGPAARNSQVVIEVSPTSSSPRAQINMFRTENSGISIPNRSSPMEIFLKHDGSVSGIHGDDPVTSREERGRLRSLRTNSLRFRSQLRTKRMELREKELAKATADESFIRYTREKRLVMDSGTSATAGEDPINTYYTAMQIARDEYGPLEDDYNRLENILDQMEFEMAKIEARLYGPESPQELENPDTIFSLQRTGDPLPLDLDPLLGLSMEVQEQYEPIHREFLSRLGDLDLARERFENMRQERESLAMEQESRARFGLELHKNLKALLVELPAQEAEVKGEIAEIEVDVERLRAECLAAGIDLEESEAGSGMMNDAEIDANDATLFGYSSN